MGTHADMAVAVKKSPSGESTSAAADSAMEHVQGRRVHLENVTAVVGSLLSCYPSFFFLNIYLANIQSLTILPEHKLQSFYWIYRQQSKFGHVFDIHPRVFVMDANACGSPDMKALKAAVAEIKASIVEVRLPVRALCN